MHWAGAALSACVALSGCGTTTSPGLSPVAPWNAQTRGLGPELPAGDSAYVQSDRPDGRNYGCSFIEFDGKGDFINPEQYGSAEKRLRELKARSRVLLVIYCHGWNNNAQSADVLKFMSFLRRLSAATMVRTSGMRVEGVYLAWRGSQYRPVIGKADQQADPALAEDFHHQNLVDAKWQLSDPEGWLLTVPKYTSYWSIKDRAELQVCRVPLARSVFGLAFAVKAPADGSRNRVFVLGHSFGALALEQTLGEASVGLLSSEWNWNHRESRWPIDLMVFLNSAAPSLYAKQLNDFLWTDHRLTARPRIISLTSTGDWATGALHPIGNFGNRFATDLQHKYYVPDKSGIRMVTAGDYYALTPGHNSYLINHVVQKDERVPLPPDLAESGVSEPISDDRIFSDNMKPVPGGVSPDVFFARSSLDHQIHAWELKDQSNDAKNPEGVHTTNYWIGTVPKDIIKDHNDIWSPASMEMLAGIYRIAERLSTLPPPRRQGPVMPLVQ